MTAPLEVQPVHFRNGGSFTGTECRLGWDSERWPTPDPLTRDIDEVTCRACKAHMIKEGQCPACAAYALRWSAGPVKLTPVVDGRLTMRDVETQFYLGCEECSETLITGVTAEDVLPLMNSKRWRP